MIRKLMGVGCVAALALAGPAGAQHFSPASAPNRDGTPFWDVDSDDDGRGCNIGYVLTGTMAGCIPGNVKLLPGYTAPFDASFTGASFAHGWGNVNQSVGFFYLSEPGAVATYWGGIAGADPLRDMVIRDLSTSTIVHTFQYNVPATHSYTFSTWGWFDFGIVTIRPGSTEYSWTTTLPNHFAGFASGSYTAHSAACGDEGCWIGGEDAATRLDGSVSDFDYNDGVLSLKGGRFTVPEPASAILVAVGMTGLLALTRRRALS